MKKRRLPLWPRLPRQFPVSPQTELGLAEGQVVFLFHNRYLARRRPSSFRKEGRISMQNEGCMQYCREHDRWMVYDAYDKPVGLHCGDGLDILIGNVWLTCRIELDTTDWFVIFASTTVFHLHPGRSYKVKGL